MTTTQVTRPLRAGRAVAPAMVPGRTLFDYLLVPRPKDLAKAVVVPLTFALGVAANGGATATQLWQALVVWLVLELLVYQARYQWNDARGFVADQAHPECASRGRLPGPIERARPHIAASLSVAAARLALTGAVALAIPGLRSLIIAMTISVFSVAFLYEEVRSMAGGSSTAVPVPLRPSLIALWVAVGAGYAVRGLTGLALAVNLGGRPWLVVTGAVALWAVGIVFVTCRWALEAMCFASFRGRRVVWNADDAKARDHTLALVRWLPSTHSLAADAEPSHWRALQGSTSSTAPWHLALFVAAAAAAVAGRLLVSGLGTSSAALVAVVAAGAAAVITRLPGRRASAALAAGLALSGAQWAAGFGDPLVATLPWLAVMVAYASFTHQCASEIGRPLHRLEPLLRR